MIEKLSIQNFQSHKNTELIFDKGVNVIIGSSDSGKTAILRALRWLMWNKPGGDSFRSYWGGDTIINAEMDGFNISRSKGSANLYEVNDTEFTAFGASVPEEIQKVLNISEINLQQQLDSPFLLTETPGNVAKHFNKIAKLNKIDEATSELKKEINSINTTIRVKQEKLNEYETELKQIPDLDVIEVKLGNLEQLELTRNSTAKRKSQLLNLLADLEEVTEKQGLYKDLLTHEVKVNSIFELIEQRGNKYKKITALKSIVKSIELIEQQEEDQTIYISLENPVKTLLNKIADKRNLSNRKNVLSTLVREITVTNTKLLKTQENVLQLEETLHKNIGEICPLCGTKLK